MKRTLSVLLFLVMFALLPAEARKTTLKRADVGLVGAMQRMGCSSQWLSVVMKRNAILESELRSLPAGLALVMPDNCRGKNPGRRSRVLSARILARGRAAGTAQNPEVVRKLQKEKEELTQRFETQKREFEDTRSRTKVLSAQVDTLNKKLAETNAALLASRKSLPWWLIVVAFIAGAALAGLAAWLAFRQFTRRMEITERVIRVDNDGEKLDFVLATPPPTYRCPLCGDNVEGRHINRHVRRAHERAAQASAADSGVREEIIHTEEQVTTPAGEKTYTEKTSVRTEEDPDRTRRL